MSTHSLFLLTLVIILAMSIFVGMILPDVDASFGVGNELEEPDVWDVLSFIGGGFFAILSFSIPGVPWIFGMFFWLLAAINLWCLVNLIRGTS